MLTILIHDSLLLLKIDIAWEASWFTKSLLDNTSTSYDDHLVTTWMVKCYPYWQFENYFTSFLREFLKGKRGSRCCFSFPFYIPMVALSVRSFFFFFFYRKMSSDASSMYAYPFGVVFCRDWLWGWCCLVF